MSVYKFLDPVPSGDRHPTSEFVADSVSRLFCSPLPHDSAIIINANNLSRKEILNSES
jgi:hypothetical protein